MRQYFQFCGQLGSISPDVATEQEKDRRKREKTQMCKRERERKILERAEGEEEQMFEY